MVSLANLLGLTLGFVAVFYIMLWVVSEITYNGSYKNLDRILLVTSRPKGATDYRPFSPFPVPNREGYESLPEVEAFATLARLEHAKISYQGNKVAKAHGYATTVQFSKVFDLELAQGTFSKLTDSSRVVYLTQSLANRMFGDANPIGQTVNFIFHDTTSLTIAGVVRTPEFNSSLQFEFLVPYYVERNWGRLNLDFLLVKQNASIDNLEAKVSLLNGIPSYFGADGAIEMDTKLFPLSDLYFDSELTGFAHGSMSYVWIALFSAIVISIASLINHINIMSTLLLARHKSLGVRKILGAASSTFYWEFVAESSLFLLTSVVLATTLCFFLYPIWSSAFDVRGLEQSVPWSRMLAIVIALVLVGSLLAGLILRLLVNTKNPLSFLKGNVVSGQTVLGLKEKLMIVQMTLAMTGVALSLLLRDQLNYMTSLDPGYQLSNIVKANIFGEDFNWRNTSLQNSQATFVDAALQSDPSVLAFDRGDFPTETTLFSWKMKADAMAVDVPTMAVGSNFFNLFGLDLIIGTAVQTSGQMAVVNESAVKHFGISDPIGHQIKSKSWGEFTIVGVVRNFNFESTGKQIGPLVIVCQPYLDRPLIVQIAPGRTKQALDLLARIHKEINPGLAFEYEFLDWRFNQIFQRDRNISTIIHTSTAIAVAISLLGLFSFAIAFTRDRQKEISVRKIFGASVSQIVAVLNLHFAKRWAISFFLATCASVYLSSEILHQFSNRVELSYLQFFNAGMVVVLLGFFVVFWLVYRSANMNPAKTLRQE